MTDLAATGRRSLFTRAFALVFLANLCQGWGFNLFLHLPGFLSDLGANDVVIGFIFGVTGVTAIAARPPIGRFMDLRGRRGIILVGGVLNVCAGAAYLTVEAIGPWIVCIRVFHGLAEGMLFTGLFTYGADCVPADRRTQGLALFGVSGMAPIALGATLGDEILKLWDFQGLFWAALGFAVLSLLFSLPLRDVHRAQGETAEPSRGFLAALRQRELLPLWWIGAIFAVALASVFTFLKRYVDETGHGTVPGFFNAYTAMALLLRVFLGWLPDRIGPLRVLLPALVCLVLAFSLLALADGSAEVVMAGLLFGVGHGFTFPILFGIVVTRARDSDRGSAMGILTGLFDLGVVLGGPFFGAIITGWGFSAAFGTAAAVVALGTAVFVVWDTATRRV
ncbi:MAG: MFS transporter [Myxococcota bacterium]